MNVGDNLAAIQIEYFALFLYPKNRWKINADYFAYINRPHLKWYSRLFFFFKKSDAIWQKNKMKFFSSYIAFVIGYCVQQEMPLKGIKQNYISKWKVTPAVL